MFRRKFVLGFLALLGTGTVASLWGLFSKKLVKGKDMIKKKSPIDLHFPTMDPFLFCAHHNDHFPVGNKELAVDKKHFVGRQMGQDFNEKDGFRMYHGNSVPGFPVHPHRGFETITIVRRGYVDHADSLGAAGRYGEGDIQWMTAGEGVQHSEMFPLLHQDKPNTVELFQIWLNLPAKSKKVTPDFKMFWANEIPKIKNEKKKFELSLICGEFEGEKFYNAPKASWASDESHGVNIFLVKLSSGGKFNLEESKISKNRMLYFFDGKDISLNGEKEINKMAYILDEKTSLEVTSENGAEFLILEGAPINEPVFQHGPFVMNTRDEIIKTFEEYQKTQFGGWNWERADMVHGDKIERFAKYPNGKVVRPS